MSTSKKRRPNSSSKKRPNRSGKRPQSRGGFKKSTLDPNRLIKSADKAPEAYVAKRTIDDLPISEGLKERLKKKGFERPSEIQDKTYEHLAEERDLLGIAQTGSGKTGAFLIPIIEKLLKTKTKEYALVVVPTRELATQIEEEFRSMTKGLKLYSHCFIGGTNINKDFHNLRRPAHIVIATPGRLIDLVNRKGIDLRRFNTLILDEFDRMLDMGFINDVQRILNFMKNRQQTLLFSATLNKSQSKLINDILHNPITVKVSSGQSTGDYVDQDIIRIKEGDKKFDILCDLLNSDGCDRVIVFEETKRKVNRLTSMLNKAGITSREIHGNKSQNARQNALDSFKKGSVKVLVATDVAARGIDVSDVTHVINYQVPQTYDTYIHRIGRTGRAGKAGKAFTFVV